MSLKEHELYRATFSNTESWIPEDKKALAAMRKLAEERSLSPKQRYEIGSFLWCETLYGVFNRLEKIREMTGRSIHRRKGEDKSTVTKEWMVYNYHIYIAIYQSILDIALLLVNEILDLGNPYRQCTYKVIHDNRRVKAAGVEFILRSLKQMTDEHREGKNLLFHQGKGVTPPIRVVKPTVFNIADLAKNSGIEEEAVIAALEEFLAVRNQKELVQKMESECYLLELRIKRLFDKLLPHYIRIQSFYDQ